MVKHCLLFVVLVVGMPALSASPTASSPSTSWSTEDSRPAPSLHLTETDGSPYVTEDFTGNITLIHFWATWCVPCRHEFPDLQALWKRYRNKGLRIIAVAEDSHEAVKEYLPEIDISFPVLVDQYGSGMHDYRVIGLPTSYLIDAQGRLLYSAIGRVLWMEQDTLKRIEGLLPTTQDY
ncbi:MAG: TlpA family protein disulfide reductase [Gammaproteobacteria bacterium]|nr:TlpA family protein disulfide reductase [Gammaproteobacteria bacterium]